MDLTGIDINYHVRMARYEETGDESQKPKKPVVEEYEKEEWGRKTGKGWYEYDEQGQKVLKREDLLTGNGDGSSNEEQLVYLASYLDEEGTFSRHIFGYN